MLFVTLNLLERKL